jgi:hypothetical protein
MKKKNEFSSLLANVAGSDALRGTLGSAAIPPRSGRPSGSSLSGSGEMRPESLSSVGHFKSGIEFGSPSDNRTSPAQGTSEWMHLLKATTSGGLASAFGGGILSALGGLGGLASGVSKLFKGEKKTPAPLTLFHLPDSQNQSLSFGSGVLHSPSASPAYGVATPGANQPNQQPPYQYQSAQIAQAVKQALLQSSSLNDVIAEL